MDYLLFFWIGTGILLTGLVAVTLLWPAGGVSRTFSQHAASSRAAMHYYAGLFTVTLPLLAVFFFGWLTPRYDLGVLFVVFLAGALGAQLLCAYIPEVAGVRATAHRLLALISALALMAAVVTLVVTGQLSDGQRSVGIAATLVMGVLLALLVLTRAVHHKVLLIQAGYFLTFFIVIGYLVLSA